MKKLKKIEICPVCKSPDIFLYMGGQIGMLYKCNACGYIGPIVLEKDLGEYNKKFKEKIS